MVDLFRIEHKQFKISGEDAHLLSGEMPYYRVEPDYWRKCLRHAKSMGLNTVSFYIPWIVHEYQEDKFDFDGSTNRRFNLKLWLELIKEENMFAIVRPGPYVYNETLNAGIPQWFIEKYPQARGVRWNGKEYKVIKDAVSYMHPDFRSRVEIWYKNVADVLKPYLYSNGGPIIFVQLDNEVPGIQEWRGGFDQNPETMRYGHKDGYFSIFLRNKYKDIKALNNAYGSNYSQFEDISPQNVDITSEQWKIDEYEFYYNFYLPQYFVFLQDTLKSYGIDGYFTINAASGDYIFRLKPSAKKCPNTLLGVDSYYNLHKSLTFDSATLSFDIEYVYELLSEAIEGPETILEFQAGMLHDYPRVYGSHLYLWYAWALIEGFKGLNGFNIMSGINPHGLGSMQDSIYYQTPITDKGELRENYFAIQKALKLFGHDKWLLHSTKKYEMALGIIEDRNIEHQLAHMLFNFNISYRVVDLKKRTVDELLQYPFLWVCSGKVMDGETQQKLINFVESGGKLILSGALPEKDTVGRKVDILKSEFGIEAEERSNQPKVVINGVDYYTGNDYELPLMVKCSTDCKVIANSVENKPVIIAKKIGNGKVVYIGFNINYCFDDQYIIIKNIFDELGVKRFLEANNDVRVIVRTGKDGMTKAFVMNYHPMPVNARIKIFDKSYNFLIQAYDIIWFDV